MRSHEEKPEESQDSQAIGENIRSHRSFQSRAMKAGKNFIRRNKEEHASGGEASERAINGRASHVIYAKEELFESKGKTDQRSKRSIEEDSFEITRSKERRFVTLCNLVH